jgi:hypothetical protein
MRRRRSRAARGASLAVDFRALPLPQADEKEWIKVHRREAELCEGGPDKQQAGAKEDDEKLFGAAAGAVSGGQLPVTRILDMRTVFHFPRREQASYLEDSSPMYAAPE